jgi:aspartate aminotransferase
MLVSVIASELHSEDNCRTTYPAHEWGSRAAETAIITYTEENWQDGRIPDPDNVIVSSDAKQAILNVLQTLLNPQDEVIILAPYWVSYSEMVKMALSVPVIVVTPEDGGSATKAIIVNSPNNSSGLVFYLIMDDIYHKLMFDGRRPAPVL